MRFQKTTEYAIRVMVYLANFPDEWYSVNRLHQVLHIPYKYLGRLMHTMSRAGLLEVTQGKQGGYRLNRQKTPVYLYEIVGAIEGLDSYQRCVLGFPECSEENPCPLHRFWLAHQEGLKEMVYNLSLDDLKSGLTGKF